MKKQVVICASLLLLSLGATQAQTVYAGPGLVEPVLPPYEIMSIVRSTGLAPLTRPMRRGPYYVLVAVDRVGRQMRVLVDAQLGDIVNMRPALAVGPLGPEVGRPYGLPPAPPPDANAAAAYNNAAPNNLAPLPPRSFAATPRVASAPATTLPPATGTTVAPGTTGAVNVSAASATPAAAGSATAPAASHAPASLPATRLTVVEPALPPPPPLPRPRPKLALNDAAAAAAPTLRPPAPAMRTTPAGPSQADEAAQQQIE